MGRVRSLAVVVLLFLGVVLPAPAANAAWRNGSCESNDFCVWKGTQWSGGMRDLPNAVLTWSQNDASFVNQDSSWHNRYFQPIRVYKNASYGGGTEVCVNPGVMKTAGILSTYDDDGQSNHNVSSCSSFSLAQELSTTEVSLARTCLTAAGHAVQPPDPALNPALEPPGTVVLPANRGSEKAWEALSESRRAAATRAMFGSDTKRVSVQVGDTTVSTNADGCLSQVRAKLYGDLETYLAQDSGWTPVSANALNRARGLVQSNETP